MSGVAGKLALSVVPQSSNKATASVIILHGTGHTGPGLKEWVKLEMGEDLRFPHARVIYPTAPERPYTPYQGTISTVWFDRLKLTNEVPEHLESINLSCDLINDLVSEEVSRGIPINRIIIGGVSMGSCLAMHLAYRYQFNIAGVFVLSGFLNRESMVYKTLSERESSAPPLLMCHGNKDPLVSFNWGQETFDNLEKCGVNGKFHAFPNLLHEINNRELLLVKEWIEKQIPDV